MMLSHEFQIDAGPGFLRLWIKRDGVDETTHSLTPTNLTPIQLQVARAWYKRHFCETDWEDLSGASRTEHVDHAISKYLEEGNRIKLLSNIALLYCERVLPNPFPVIRFTFYKNGHEEYCLDTLPAYSEPEDFEKVTRYVFYQGFYTTLTRLETMSNSWNSRKEAMEKWPTYFHDFLLPRFLDSIVDNSLESLKRILDQFKD